MGVPPGAPRSGHRNPDAAVALWHAPLPSVTTRGGGAPGALVSSHRDWAIPMIVVAVRGTPQQTMAGQHQGRLPEADASGAFWSTRGF